MFDVKWIGQGGFYFNDGKADFAIDPYLSDLCEIKAGQKRLVPPAFEISDFAPDYLLFTHDHIDHLDTITIEGMKKGKTQYVAPPSCRKILLSLGIDDDKITVINRYDSLKLGTSEITAVYADHTPDSVGYLVKNEGISIYFTGDTLFGDELGKGISADILMTCINGRWGNMDHNEAAQTALRVGAKLAIPNHYGMFAENTADPLDFVKAAEERGIKTFVMDYNKPFDLLALYKERVLKLVWADEFDYTGLPDESKWSYEVGGHGWGNKEQQFYTDKRIENGYVEDSCLHIVCRKEKYENNEYTSCKLSTYGSASWKCGRFEFRAKLPAGKGTWPALWMMPDSFKERKERWPACGEIDILEHWGENEEFVLHSLHTGIYNHVLGTQINGGARHPGACSEFHNYVFDWKEDSLEFFYDGESVTKFVKGENGRDITNDGWPLDKKYYLLMNFACGGNGAIVDDSILPAEFVIDYVRVYQD